MIEKFMNEDYEEGENYREFLKLSCQGKVGEICSFCCEWTGPSIERYPKPVPDHSCLPEYHYLSYQETPKEERDSDDWQPRVQATKEHGSGRLVSSDPDCSICRYVYRKKKAEEKAKESKEAKYKLPEDYPWIELYEDVIMLRKLRVPELNKYVNHHGLKQP